MELDRGRLVERNGWRQHTQVRLIELSVLGPGDRPVYEGAEVIGEIPIPAARRSSTATGSPPRVTTHVRYFDDPNLTVR